MVGPGIKGILPVSTPVTTAAAGALALLCSAVLHAAMLNAPNVTVAFVVVPQHL